MGLGNAVYALDQTVVWVVPDDKRATRGVKALESLLPPDRHIVCLSTAGRVLAGYGSRTALSTVESIRQRVMGLTRGLDVAL